MSRTFFARLDLSQFRARDRATFRKRLDRETRRLMGVLPRRARSWGLARKLLNMFLRDALYSTYLEDAYGLHLIQHLLEVPLDSISAKRILAASCSEGLPAWPGVKHLEPAVSEKLQAAAAKLARPYEVSPVHMDTIWWGARDEDAEPRLAISVRQPYADWIVQGRKTIEVRSVPTNVRERVYVYSSRAGAPAAARARQAVPSPSGPAYGHIIGTVRVIDCRPLRRTDSRAAGFPVTGTSGLYAYLLAEPSRLKRPLRPKKHPNPIWFEPF